MSTYRLTRRGERVRDAAIFVGSALSLGAFVVLGAAVTLGWWFG